MDTTIGKAPKFTNPKLVDRVLGFMQDRLLEGLGWLDYAFGRSQRLVTRRDQKDYYYPGVYIGGNEYINVLPGQGLGNRTFFIVDDPVELNTKHRLLTLQGTVSLVCWYDLSRIYEGTTERNTEAVKWEILRTLDGMVFPTGMWMAIGKMYERAENIFREYSLGEVDTQYLMQPYGGVRIELELAYREECV